MSQARYVLPSTLGALLSAAAATAAADAWDCRPVDGGWDCRDASFGVSDSPFADPGPPVPPASTKAPSAKAPIGAVAQRPGGKRSSRRPAPPAPGVTPPVTVPVPATLDDGLAWGWCGVPSTGLPAAVAKGVPPGTMVEAEADSAELMVGSHVANLSGDVRLRYGDGTLRADAARYERDANAVTAAGNVMLARPDLRITGDQGQFALDTQSGEFSGAGYRLVGFNARGTAERIRVKGEALSEFDELTYTTCPPGDSAWLISARSLELDRAEGYGEARDAVLRLADVPVAYVPRFKFPIDERRRSGFLYPSIGGGDNGLDLSVPYYFNLAPNYDLTLVPRILSDRGAMLGGEFRHLSPTSWSVLRGDLLPHDSQEPDLGVRGSVSVQHHQTWGRLSGSVIYNHVSDDFFLSDIGSSIGESSLRYLDRRGTLSYAGDGWSATAAVVDYQVVEAGVTPYRLLPTVIFAGATPQQVGAVPLNLALAASYSNFDRDEGVVGQRMDLYPSLTAPLRSTWGYVTPKLGLRHTSYALEGEEEGSPDSPSRTLGIGSVDSGLFFERDTSWFGRAVTQTLEPRLYYLIIPHNDQDDLPVFDTTQFEQIYESLFLENQFTGPDRVNDMNRLSAGVSTRFLAGDTGAELLRLSVGQGYYFADRTVQLPGNPVETSSVSPVIGEAAVQLDRHWSVMASGQWDPTTSSDSNLPDKSSFRVTYRGDDGRFVRARYGQTETVTEFADVALSWPIGPKVSAMGRFAYSLQDEEVMEAMAGIEYGSCCWRLRAFVRQALKPTSVDDVTVGEHKTSFLVQLELRGLGGFGALGGDADEFIDRSLHGYLKNDTYTR